MGNAKKRKEGQASFEYILVAAVIGLTVLPAAYLFYRYSFSTADQIDKAQMDKLGRDLAATAEKIYYQGAPSRTELEARMPKGILNVSIIGEWGKQNQMLILRAKSAEGPDTDYPYPVKVNVNGTFNASLYDATVGAGIKKINVEAYETPPGPQGATTSFVFINFGGRCPLSVTYDFDHDGADNDDLNFFDGCRNSPMLNARPSGVWRRGWFDSTTGVGYQACVNADYDGDCDVDDSDLAAFCAQTTLC